MSELSISPSVSIPPTQVMSNTTFKPTYDQLEAAYNNLLKEHTILKDVFQHAIDEARADRDFYEELYFNLLNGEEDAA